MPTRKTYKDKIRELVELETNDSTGLLNNKVSKFAYTQTAYERNDAKGVTVFDLQKDQNIPEATAEAMEVNETIINKGYRTQSIALGRMIMNHFFGRTSYNLNKIHDFFTEFMKNFMTQFANHAIWDLQALDTNEATDFDTMIESGTYKGEDFISTTAYPEWFDQNGGPSQYGKWSCVVECGKGYRRQYLHYTRIAGAPELQGNYTAIRTMTETPEGDIDDYGTWTSKAVEADHALLADNAKFAEKANEANHSLDADFSLCANVSCNEGTKRFITFVLNQKKSIRIKKNTFIRLFDGKKERRYILKEDTVMDLTTPMQQAANASSFRQGQINGRNFYLYLVPVGEGNETKIVVSCNSTYPNDINPSYTATNTRKIGQFHTLCTDAGAELKGKVEAQAKSGLVIGDKYLVKPYSSREDNDFYNLYNRDITNVEPGSRYDVITVKHPLAGYKAGEILPESIFCLSFLPYASAEGMVYDVETDKCFDVYLQSGTSKNTASEYNATITDTRPQENHEADMRQVKKRLLFDNEFTSMSMGSNQRTNIKGSKDPVTTGGHVDTSDSRMVSFIGAEDCCGALYQWAEELGPAGGSGWSTYDGQGSFGQTYGTCYGLRFGGDWGLGSSCGSRCRSAVRTRSYAGDADGGRGSSWLRS